MSNNKNTLYTEDDTYNSSIMKNTVPNLNEHTTTSQVHNTSLLKETSQQFNTTQVTTKENLVNLANEKPRYSDKKNLFDFCKKEDGLRFLVENFRLNAEHSLIEKIDYIIDFYTAWASKIPVRKNLQMSKYEFLKHVESAFVSKSKNTYTDEGEELANELFNMMKKEY